MKQKMTSYLGRGIICFYFWGYFGENLSNSISTPNFVMIRQETTKLEGVHNAPLYTAVLVK